MSNKIINNAEDKNKKLKLIADGAAMVVGIFLFAIGCSQIYKIGYDKGMNKGKNYILDEIVDHSVHKGLVMVNSDRVRYLFSAEKLSN